MVLQQQVYKGKEDQSAWFKFLACLPSKIFSTMASFRSLLYQWDILSTRKLPGRCISVGNLCLGGTGKTPLVIEIAKVAIADQKKVMILTRGYKSGLNDSEYIVLKDGNICFGNQYQRRVYADEAMLQSKALPNAYVVVGSQRYLAARRFLDHLDAADNDFVFILDDGFQHLQIYRDLNILLLDAEKPFGNGEILPLGSLREPVSAAKRCDMVVWTRTNLAPKFHDYKQRYKDFIDSKSSVNADFVEGKIFEVANYKLSLRRPEELAQIKFFAVTAIAKPNRFFDSLKKIGVDVGEQIFFSDHERFNFSVIDEKISHFDAIIITAKDYWREPEFFNNLPISVYILDLDVRFSSSVLEKAVLELLTS